MICRLCFVYEGFDRFCEKEDIRDDEEEVFYGAAFDEFNREWQGIASEEQTEPTSHCNEKNNNVFGSLCFIVYWLWEK